MIPIPPAALAAVSIVPDNLTAFALRALSARAATRTLDLQYYLWEEDLTGRFLVREVLRAADRGIQVRLLLDDLNVRGSERELATLAQHPSIDIRLYNPFHIRSWGLFGKGAEFLIAGYRLNHRMHNKAWVVDGELMIGGGRNIGDEYFGASHQFNFRDLDLAIAGAVARQAVALFDAYWTSTPVWAIEQVAMAQPLEGGLNALRQRLDCAIERSASGRAYVQNLRTIGGLATLLEEGRTLLSLDKVRVLADPPGKGMLRRHEPSLLPAIRAALDAARYEVILISPYFVPGRRGMRLLVSLARRGVRVSVLTNSLAATDVLAVHGGYARYRRRLLRAGIELHELRRGGQEGKSLFGSGGASLHTKAFCIDGELIFAGSFNLDPRSANLNTEMGTFVKHPIPAAQLRQEFARSVEPARSWKVYLTSGRLIWDNGIEGPARLQYVEPDTTLARRILARVLGWLPIEAHL